MSRPTGDIDTPGCGRCPNNLPTNPGVEDIYDAVSDGKIQVDEFGNQINRKPPSALDKFGDFVNGTMRL